MSFLDFLLEVHHFCDNQEKRKGYEDAGKGLYMIFACPDKHCKNHYPPVPLLAASAYLCKMRRFVVQTPGSTLDHLATNTMEAS